MKLPSTFFFALFLSICVFSSVLGEEYFSAAQPVWPSGRETELNLTTGFRAALEIPQDQTETVSAGVVLNIAVSSFYRAYLNGEFLGRGPARGPHGFYRVDRIELGKRLKPGRNLLAIEVAGYNVNGYALLAQPSFLQAEVSAGGRVLAATGQDGAAGFTAVLPTERVRKVQRYSYQRAFTEVYRLSPGCDDWKRAEDAGGLQEVKCAVQPSKNLIPRRVPYPEFGRYGLTFDVSRGSIRTDVKPDSLWRNRSMTIVGPQFLGFKESELEVIPSIDLQYITNSSMEAANPPLEPIRTVELSHNSYHILDFGCNYTGFIGARVTARENTLLYVVWDEELTDGDVDFKRMSCVNAIRYDLAPGTYEIESFEPYTLRYLKLIVVDGACKVDRIFLRNYVNPEAEKSEFTCSNYDLNRLFEAGRETFRQNATDIFMDCPSRERAGWLCDSYYTARAALDLCGNTLIEHNFFENFALPDSFKYLPKGMVPMCYPADQFNGNYLPTWAIWFVVQLEEYLQRSGDRETVDELRGRVLELFDYFKPYENSDGLLEKLDGWVILEWSAMNDFVNDVNYPINMLYAMALDATAKMYGMPEMAGRAEKVRQVIRAQSYDGEFFVDNAVRTGGKLVPTNNRTESCQYYAFLSGVATDESYPELSARLLKEFGPERLEAGRYKDVHTITPFIGYQLRLDFLSGRASAEQVELEALARFLPMARRNGTLWEMDYPTSSRNHGFQSHVCHVILRDILGLQLSDPVAKQVSVRFSPSELLWCEGSIPVADGEIRLQWWREEERICYKLTTPPEYEVETVNASGRALERRP